MTNPDLWPETPSETRLVIEADEAVRERKRLARIEALVRRGALRLGMGHQVRRVPDERFDGGAWLWATNDGELFTEVPDLIDAHPDVVAVDVVDGMRYVLLTAIDDPDVYALEVQRARRRRDDEEAHRVAEHERITRERAEAPKQPIGARHPYTLTALLDRARANDVLITVHDGRPLVAVPTKHLDGFAYRAAVDALAPLIAATNVGASRVPCDVGCGADAETVGCGGAWLCIEHGR